MKVDIVLDLAAGKQWPGLLEILKKGGKHSVVGAITGPIMEMDVRNLYLKDLSLFGATYQSRESFQSLTRYIGEGRLEPIIAAEYSLEHIVKSSQAFLSKTLAEKFVLNFSSEQPPQIVTLTCCFLIHGRRPWLPPSPPQQS